MTRTSFKPGRTSREYNISAHPFNSLRWNSFDETVPIPEVLKLVTLRGRESRFGHGISPPNIEGRIRISGVSASR